jgi:tryptophan synthase alpha chain
MPYFPVGYPDLETSVDVIESLAKNGADLVEVGLPFSDPLADGPVIQKATQTALEHGVTVKKALAAVAELRSRGVTIPLVLMGYYNPILAYGPAGLVRDAACSGADGFIIPDLPPEESGEFEDVLDGTGMHLIRMLAPTTPPERMERIARSAQGFIYLVSVTGITGERKDVALGLGELIACVRKNTSVPVCVGFGIGTPEQAQTVGRLADGVIVGTACVQAIGQTADPVGAAKEFVMSYRKVLQKA